MIRRFHIRVDNRLLHGQIVQFWISHLGVIQLIVAETGLAGSDTLRKVYRLAVPEGVGISFCDVSDVAQEIDRLSDKPTLVLFADVFDVARAVMCGAQIDKVTLGNVHGATDRQRITDAVFLSVEEIAALCRMSGQGVHVEIQTFPGDILLLHTNDHGGPRWARP